MDSREDFFSRLDNLLVFRRGGMRSPHKPLYLLFCIAGVQRDNPRLHRFEDVQVVLKKALRTFGPRSKTLHPEYPFWHLRRDNLADFVFEKELVIRRSSSNPTVKSLKAANARGGLVEADFRLLSGNLPLQSLTVHRILDAHFPSSIHDELIRFFGLTLDSPHAKDRVSDCEFQERVLAAYQNRCAITGFQLMFEGLPVGVDAAHIFWPQSGGNDDVSNGVAMTSLHRKLFHLGLFKIRPDNFEVVVSSQATSTAGAVVSLKEIVGKSIYLPSDDALWPNKDALAWHEKWVYRG
jgi:putative restriction endonuclease